MLRYILIYIYIYSNINLIVKKPPYKAIKAFSSSVVQFSKFYRYDFSNRKIASLSIALTIIRFSISVLAITDKRHFLLIKMMVAQLTKTKQNIKIYEKHKDVRRTLIYSL